MLVWLFPSQGSNDTYTVLTPGQQIRTLLSDALSRWKYWSRFFFLDAEFPSSSRKICCAGARKFLAGTADSRRYAKTPDWLTFLAQARCTRIDKTMIRCGLAEEGDGLVLAKFLFYCSNLWSVKWRAITARHSSLTNLLVALLVVIENRGLWASRNDEYCNGILQRWQSFALIRFKAKIG